MIKLLDISKICYMIERLNWYNLTTDKVSEKVPWTIYWPDRKSWKVPENSKLTFYKGQYLKPSNINLASASEHDRKKLWNLLTQLIQFTDQKI